MHYSVMQLDRNTFYEPFYVWGGGGGVNVMFSIMILHPSFSNRKMNAICSKLVRKCTKF